MGSINAFELLCSSAIANGSCWRIGCTTCGHVGWRYAFHQLSLGKHPEDTDWEQVFPKPQSFSVAYEQTKGMAFEKSEVLYDILANASVRNIADTCWSGGLPDYLGYLGLALFHMESVEREERRLTTAWCKDLLVLVLPDSQAELLLEELLNSSDLWLSWKHLELVETFAMYDPKS